MTGLPFSSRLALRQLRYKGGNLWGVFSGVCVAIVLVFVQIGFQQATLNSVLDFDRALDADLVMVGPQFEVIGTSPPWFARATLFRAQGVQGVEDARPLYMLAAQIRNDPGQEPLAARFTAFDPSRPVFAIPGLASQLHLLTLPNTALIDRRSRQGLDAFASKIAPDRPRTLYVQSAAATTAPRIDVRGTFNLGADFISFTNLLVSDLTFYRFFQIPLDRVSIGLLHIEPGQDGISVKAAVQRTIGNEARVYTHEEFVAVERDYFLYRTPVGVVFMSGIAIGVVIGIVFVLNMLHGIIDSNLSEYAVLRALGYRDRFFRSLVIQVATLITSLALIPSILITWAIYWQLEIATQLPFHLTWRQMLLVFAASLVMSMAAALLAIRKLKTSNPLDLFS